MIRSNLSNLFNEEVQSLSEPSGYTDESTSASTQVSNFAQSEDLPLFSIGITLTSIAILFGLILELTYQYRKFFFKRCHSDAVDAPNVLSQSYEGKLVYLVGKLQLSCQCFISDPVLPFFEFAEAIRVKRYVEMLQWEKHGKSFEPGWFPGPLKTSCKEYKNPVWDQRLTCKVFDQEFDGQVFPYYLSREIINLLPITSSVKIRESDIEESEYCGLQGYHVYTDCNYWYLTKNKQEKYVPCIGDYRIKYFSLELGSYVTILGEYNRGTLKKYKNKLLFADAGIVSIDKILNNCITTESFKQQIIRFLCFIIAVFGIILAATIIS